MIPHRRDQPVGISAEATALAWARTENAPDGAVVVMGQEISPRGLNGRLWTVEPEHAVAMAVVLRPDVPAARQDLLWFVAGLAAADAIADVGGRIGAPCWPDSVIDDTGNELAMLRVHVELGPAGVRFAVITVRVDVQRSDIALRLRTLLTQLVFDRVTELVTTIADPDGLAKTYTERSALTGTLVKIRLLPSGTTRGTVQGFDGDGTVLVGSSPAVCDRVTVDALRVIEVVRRP